MYSNLKTKGLPTIWQCGGVNALNQTLKGCYEVSPYKSWEITDYSAPLAGSPPGSTTARSAHSGVVMEDLLVLYGGLGEDSNPIKDPALVWLSEKQVVDESGIHPTYYPSGWGPPQRWGHSAVGPLRLTDLPGHDAALVFGGAMNGAGEPNEDIDDPDALLLLVLDNNGATCTQATYCISYYQVAARGQRPPPRHYHAAALYPSTASPTTMLVFGGISSASGALLGDFWELSLSSCQFSMTASYCSWVPRAPSGLPPTLGHKLLVTLRGSIIVYGGNSSGMETPVLLVSSSFSPSPQRNATPLAFAPPSSVAGAAPSAIFLSGAALLDADGDAEEEMVVLGGEVLEPDATHPRVVSEQVLVLSDIDNTYSSLAQELPYLLTGIGLAFAFLAVLAYVAWSRSRAQAEEAQVRRATYGGYGVGGGELDLLKLEEEVANSGGLVGGGEASAPGSGRGRPIIDRGLATARAAALAESGGGGTSGGRSRSKSKSRGRLELPEREALLGAGEAWAPSGDNSPKLNF